MTTSAVPTHSELTLRHHADLIAALGSAADALTPPERNTLVWLAGWDQPTVDALVGIFGKLSRS